MTVLPSSDALPFGVLDLICQQVHLAEVNILPQSDLFPARSTQQLQYGSNVPSDWTSTADGLSLLSAITKLEFLSAPSYARSFWALVWIIWFSYSSSIPHRSDTLHASSSTFQARRLHHFVSLLANRHRSWVPDNNGQQNAMINGRIILVDLSEHWSTLARISNTVSESRKIFQVPDTGGSLVKLKKSKGYKTPGGATPARYLRTLNRSADRPSHSSDHSQKVLEIKTVTTPP